MRHTPKILTVLLQLVLVIGLAQVSYATLADVGSVDPTNGFPVWYQDGDGVSLEQCNFSGVATDPYCKPAVLASTLPPLDFREAFWWSAKAAITGQGVDAELDLALEASFSSLPPANGKQVVRSRLRIRADVPVVGQYTVTHPFGVNVYNDADIDPDKLRIDDTIEIGGPAGDFVTVLGSGNIGPFLQCTAPARAGYIGNYPSACTVTGSPTLNNLFRIQGPGGIDLSTNQFIVSGKLYAGAPPLQLTVDRTTYRCPASGKCTIDVWATSSPGAIVKISDSKTPARFLPTQLQEEGGKFFGSVNVPANTGFPITVKITSDDLINTPVTKKSKVLEQVEISVATFNLGTGMCTISASSSDKRLPPPTLTVEGYGDLVGGTYAFSTAAPPPTVTVTSSKGGTSQRSVKPVGRY